jgi:tellurite resistance protein TerC
VKRSASWTAVWVSLAVVVGVIILAVRGGDDANQYFTAYVIELALSVDNVLLFAALFRAFAIPAGNQRRLLNLGVLGALVGRAVFIIVGVSVLDRFRVALFVLGGLLVVLGVRMARPTRAASPEGSRVLRLVRRTFPGVTPAVAALITIEVCDLIFAVDSVPAALAVTTDTLVVFASNALAVVGLRSLYFLVAGLIDRLKYLQVGLAVGLVFLGVKLLAADAIHIPTPVSLLVVVTLILVASLVSLAARPAPTRGPARGSGLGSDGPVA